MHTYLAYIVCIHTYLETYTHPHATHRVPKPYTPVMQHTGCRNRTRPSCNTPGAETVHARHATHRVPKPYTPVMQHTGCRNRTRPSCTSYICTRTHSLLEHIHDSCASAHPLLEMSEVHIHLYTYTNILIHKHAQDASSTWAGRSLK